MNRSPRISSGSITPTTVRRFTHATVATSLLVLTATVAIGQTTTVGIPIVPQLQEIDLDYRLNIGDVVEISVRGFPDLRHRSPVELNGEVSLPLAGRIRVANMTIPEAQAAIKKLVTARPLNQRSSDGRETYTVLAADDVNIAVAEYRPVYVLGDVGKPGELAFRPGLTARQAVALAGGFDVMRYRLVNPFTESADMKSHQESLWTEYARVRVKIGRIRSELDGVPILKKAALQDVPLTVGFISEIFDTEAETLKRRMEDYSAEREHIVNSIAQAKEKVATLTALLRNEEDGLKEDKKEYSDLVEFNRRGAVPMLRMMDIRRIQSASSTRVFQARTQLDQAKRELAELTRSLGRLENSRRTELLKDLQDANVSANTLQARIAANTEKLVHTSLLKSRLVRGPGAKPTIHVFRSNRNTRQMVQGDEDTLLLPGDTVEITLQNEFDIEQERPSVPVRNANARAPL